MSKPMRAGTVAESCVAAIVKNPDAATAGMKTAYPNERMIHGPAATKMSVAQPAAASADNATRSRREKGRVIRPIARATVPRAPRDRIALPAPALRAGLLARTEAVRRQAR